MHVTPRIKAVSLGVGAALALFAGASLTASGVVVDTLDVCVSCGLNRGEKQVMGIPITIEFSETHISRSLFPFVDDSHQHSWAQKWTKSTGWKETSKSRGSNRWTIHQRVLLSAHDVLGDDPEVVGILREYVALDPDAEEERLVLVRKARILREASGR